MRLARVIGKVVLTHQLDQMRPGNYLIVRTMNRGTLAGENEGNDETLVTYDELSAREGDVIGLVEGREATAPFHPDRVPFDCYNGLIVDRIEWKAVESR